MNVVNWRTYVILIVAVRLFLRHRVVITHVVSVAERVGGASQQGEGDGQTAREERETVGPRAGAEAQERRAAAQGDDAAAGKRRRNQTTESGSKRHDDFRNFH